MNEFLLYLNVGENNIWCLLDYYCTFAAAYSAEIHIGGDKGPPDKVSQLNMLIYIYRLVIK